MRFRTPLLLAVPAFFVGQLLVAQERYEHFTASVYVRAGEVARMADDAYLESNWEAVRDQVRISKVYLETHRDRQIVDSETLDKAKRYFEERGIEVAGGITLTISEPNRFETFCYSDAQHRAWVRELAEHTAAHFDEFILDDFFFTSCKNATEIEARGDRSWTEYRTQLLGLAAGELIIEPARAVNPDVRVIVKYPNWYEHFQGLGFNLETQPFEFDGVYTGTETRDAVRSAQHLQPYHGYQIFRYFDNINPGRNGGGWVDTYGSATIDRYVEQLWLTAFAKAPEITLFEIAQIQRPVPDAMRGAWQDGGTSIDFDALRDVGGESASFATAAGLALQQVDDVLGFLGNPTGVQAYRPFHAVGEDFLHNYLGMVGIPIDLQSAFPDEAGTILLTQSAAADPEIVGKIEGHVRSGGNVVLTSGLLEVLEGRGIGQIAELRHTSRKAFVQEFQSRANGPIIRIDQPILIPQVQYLTNDSWELVSAIAGPNGWPMLHDADYGDGHLYVLTIPDNFADLYRLPAAVLSSIRETLSQDIGVHLDAPGEISLFVYDNDTVVVESVRDEPVDIALVTAAGVAEARDLMSGASLTRGAVAASGGFGAPRIPEKARFELSLPPHSWRVIRLSQ